ncbi:MAG: chorismate synthase [Calditrichaeota bacterium]|nr:MAG: chorismate synthase [Calditrichota bacterium]
MAEAIELARKEGDSLGGIVEIVVDNVPAGLGEPVFEKLEAELARALLSIGAVKAFEMGSGFSAALMKGSEHNDPFWRDPHTGAIGTRTNHAGGVLGGISNGMPLVMRIAVKPPSSIRKPQESINQKGEPVAFSVKGRHDPCICPRVVPVAEAMVALVLIDMILLQERLSKQSDLESLREKIDTIDTQILLLLAQRCHLTRKIGKFKEAADRPVEDRQREAQLIDKWRSLGAELDLPDQLVSRLIEEILRASKQMQQEACLGPEGGRIHQ